MAMTQNLVMNGAGGHQPFLTQIEKDSSILQSGTPTMATANCFWYTCTIFLGWLFLPAVHLGFTCLLENVVWFIGSLFCKHLWPVSMQGWMKEENYPDFGVVFFFYANWRNPAQNKNTLWRMAAVFSRQRFILLDDLARMSPLTARHRQNC